MGVRRVFLWVSVILSLIIGGTSAAWLVGQVETNVEAPTTRHRQNIPMEQGWSRGPTAAKNILIEFSDFQCPVCRLFYTRADALLKKSMGQLKHIFYHYPLTRIHPNAMGAAWASEAAGRQGKFWEMHDLLFEKQPEWSRAKNPMRHFLGYARDLKLDIEQFKNDVKSEEVQKRVAQDMTKGKEMGVRGTPTFYLNGNQLRLLKSEEGFSKQVWDVIR